MRGATLDVEGPGQLGQQAIWVDSASLALDDVNATTISGARGWGILGSAYVSAQTMRVDRSSLAGGQDTIAFANSYGDGVQFYIADSELAGDVSDFGERATRITASARTTRTTSRSAATAARWRRSR